MKHLTDQHKHCEEIRGRNFFKLIKNIYKKSKENSTLNGEELKAFPLK